MLLKSLEALFRDRTGRAAAARTPCSLEFRVAAETEPAFRRPPIPFEYSFKIAGHEPNPILRAAMIQPGHGGFEHFVHRGVRIARKVFKVRSHPFDRLAAIGFLVGSASRLHGAH